jgi:hypothetical protein
MKERGSTAQTTTTPIATPQHILSKSQLLNRKTDECEKKKNFKKAG